MKNPKKARKAKAKLQALRAYLPDDKKEREEIKRKLTVAAGLQKRSISHYILFAALAQAERDLAANRS